MLMPVLAFGGTYTVEYVGGNLDVVGPLGGQWEQPYVQTGETYAASAFSTEEGDPGQSGPGSVTHSGTITAKFTWVPGPQNDLPPASVIVQQRASATYIGSSGNVLNGLGDPAQGSVTSKTSEGVSYVVVTDPGDYFEVQWMPVGVAELSSTYTGPPALAGAVLDMEYEASAHIPRIQFEGNKVGRTLFPGGPVVPDWLIGQEIIMTPVITGLDCQITVGYWDLPEENSVFHEAILDSSTPPEFCYYTPWAYGLEVDSLACTWFKPTEDSEPLVESSITIEIEGELLTTLVVQEQMTVSGPEAALMEFFPESDATDPPSPLINVYNPRPFLPDAATFGETQTGPDGMAILEEMNIKAYLRLPTRFHQIGLGHFGVVQLCSLDRKKFSGATMVQNLITHRSLDTSYPYQDDGWWPTASVPPVTGDSTRETFDRPSSAIAFAHTSIAIEDDFEMYLVFFPPTPGASAYRVFPVGVLVGDWSWSFGGFKIAEVWSTPSGGLTVSPVIREAEEFEPSWSAVFQSSQ